MESWPRGKCYVAWHPRNQNEHKFTTDFPPGNSVYCNPWTFHDSSESHGFVSSCLSSPNDRFRNCLHVGRHDDTISVRFVLFLWFPLLVEVLFYIIHFTFSLVFISFLLSWDFILLYFLNFFFFSYFSILALFLLVLLFFFFFVEKRLCNDTLDFN